MKILVIGFTKIKYMPYMNFYLDNIDSNANDVHVLYWNRDLKEEDKSFLSGVTFHEFRCYQEDDVSRISKLRSFSKFRHFAIRTIKEGKFDFIVFLHSLTGVLIADELKRQYANRYIFDYRDSTYEGFLPFKQIVGMLVKHSYATFVSSDAFRRFLPESESAKIYTSHNLLMDSLNHRDDKRKYGIPSKKIRIAFWGFIRHEGINREIIRKIAADTRFELHFYGREQQVARNLKAYTDEIGASNVFFHGEYKPEDRYKFILQTDIIHNIYFDSNTMLAMGNKYYDGIIFRIPQLCMVDSFMGKTITKKCIGLEVWPYDENFTDIVYTYYTNIDRNIFITSCDEATADVCSEYDKGKKKLLTIKDENF